MSVACNVESIGDKLFPLPEVAWRVLRLTSDLETGNRLLEEVIQRDPTLTSRVLRFANTAQFGFRGTVSTVRRAALILGNRRLRGIAVSLSMEGVFNRTPFGRALWDHSVTVGLVCRELALRCNLRDPEEAFVAGLLHDVGKLILDQNLGDRYVELVDGARRDNLALIDLERENLGTDHTVIGGDLARRWDLPAHLEEVVRLHHVPAEARADPNLCALVRLAQVACRGLRIGETLGTPPPTPESAADRLFFLGPEAFERACREVETEIEAERKYFGLRPSLVGR